MRNLRTIFVFQFHKGTIKTTSACFRLVAYLYFNSIKVRLKRAKIIEKNIIIKISIP